MTATEHPSASDWAGARGEKWRGQVDGMEATLEPIDEPLISALHLDRPYTIADVGCGGGGTTLEIRRRAPSGSLVHGYDISPALIELARSRIQSADDTISFDIADVATAAPPSRSYDRLLSRFGIMFYDDPSAAFANLASWLAPRGRFAFAAWDRPVNNPWFSMVREVVADIIDLPPLDPDAPGPFRYGAAETLLGLLNHAGFDDLDVRDWRGELAVGGGLSAVEAATFSLTSFSSFGELLAKSGEEAVARAHEAVTARYSKFERNGIVRLTASVHFFTGNIGGQA
ncbi:MAG TPA: class I SAM-dependent methyltransferase [Vicinamibacterales bacterium]